MKYGYIGLGNLGGHLAASLIRDGHELVVHDRDPALAERHRAMGAKVAASPADVAEQVDHVFTCLPSPAVSEAVLAAGIAIVRPNYRLSGTDLWPAQGEDCLAAARFVLDGAAGFGLDAGRFALWGQSAGGFLAVSTALGLVEGGRAPQAVVDFYGPMDFSTMDADMAALGRTAQMGQTDPADSAESQLLGYAVGSNPAGAKAVGPVGRLEAMTPRALPPLFVRHGDADPLIAATQSERLVAAWARVDPTAWVDFALVAGAGHGGGDFDTDVVMAPLRDFLTAVLA